MNNPLYNIMNKNSESYFHTLVENLTDVILVIDSDRIVKFATPSIKKLLDYEPEEIIGTPGYKFFHPEDLQRINQEIEELLAQPEKIHPIKVRAIKKDGSVRYITGSRKNLLANPEVNGIVITFHDSTDNRREELLAEARANLVEFSYGATLDEFMQKFLDEAERLTDSKIGFYHFVDDDQETLTLQMWSTNTIKTMCTAEGKGAHYPISKAGVWVDCFRSRMPVIHNDYQSLPNKKGLPAGHAEVVRELTVPLLRNNKVVAIIGVGNKTSNYDELDVKSVTKLADLAWDIIERKHWEEIAKEREASEAIKKKELEQKNEDLNAAKNATLNIVDDLILEIETRKLKEDALRESEQKYASILKTAMDGFWQMDLKGNILEVNNSICKMIDFTEEELLTMNLSDLELMENSQETTAHLKKIMDLGEDRFETRLRRRDGSILEIEVSVQFRPVYGGRFLAFLHDITNRKQSEKIILQSGKRYQTLFSEAGEGIITFTAEGKILSANKSFALTHGYAIDEIVNMPLVALISEKVKVQFIERMKAANKGELIEFETEHYRKDGSTVFLEASMNKVTIGEESFLQSFYRDVTTRKRSEALVYAQRDLARLINLSSPKEKVWAACLDIAIQISGFDCGGIYLFNEENGDLELVSHKGLSDDFIKLASRYAVDSPNVQKIRAGKPSYFGPEEITQAQLLLYEKLTAIATIPTEYRGTIIGCINVGSHKARETSDYIKQALETIAPEIANIAVQLSTERSLRQSNERIKAMLNAIPDMMFRINRDGIFLDYHAESKSLYPFDGTTLIGKRYEDITPPKFSKLLNQKISDTLQSGKLQTFEYEMSTQGYGLRKFEARMVSSGVDEVTAIVRDITERVKYEEELSLYRNSLEALVKTRTEELNKANESLKIEIEKEKEFEFMLQAALEKEKQLNDLKTRFISTASHEFRTPLASIQLSSGLLQRYSGKWDKDRLDEHYNRINKSINNLTNLLDGVLTISRADADRIPFAPKNINVKELCESVIDDLSLYIKPEHHFIFTFKTKREIFYLDSNLIRYILSNLLTNALKYSPNGGKVQFVVHTIKTNLSFKIKDSGIGIPKKEIPFLFEPFYRGSNSNNIPGSGLGLSIVQKTVEMHNGAIKVTSTENVGTVFEALIPINDGNPINE